ncbi:hypothetical protein MAR_ORF284 [Marseillevirus marseillevirus]|uniref:Uncharacterized protein n=1 Tax=Marseillevirus marseillevirus TaxID=694581 RepID=D2XAT1_GBMV|nr:hypothetical protein MAR_ORF284 [Marseillevirus marseillevirus]ADB04058.1 hypothetical protein MAR_ORF284 [Marseillevirus marseillevirus]
MSGIEQSSSFGTTKRLKSAESRSVKTWLNRGRELSPSLGPMNMTDIFAVDWRALSPPQKTRFAKRSQGFLSASQRRMRVSQGQFKRKRLLFAKHKIF